MIQLLLTAVAIFCMMAMKWFLRFAPVLILLVPLLTAKFFMALGTLLRRLKGKRF